MYTSHSPTGTSGLRCAGLQLSGMSKKGVKSRSVPERLERNRLVGRCISIMQPSTPICYVVPPTQLEADVFVRSYMLETHGLMQASATGIGQYDFRKCGPEPLLAQCRQQHAIQTASDPAATLLVTNIHCQVNCPAVGRSLAVFTGVSIADDLAATIRDQPRMRRKCSADALRHDRLRGRLSLERNSRLAHIGRVNGRYCCGIGFTGGPDGERRATHAIRIMRLGEQVNICNSNPAGR
jgi:hypothetical protein